MSANVKRMYSGENLVPWWVGVEQGDAVVLPGLLTALAAKELAVNWDPELRKIYTEFGRIEGSMAVVNPTTKQHLAVVSDEYTLLTNQALAQIAHDAVGGQALCTTAGELSQGTKVWFSMKLGSHKVDRDPSPIDLYLVITAGHDGWHRCRVLITPIRPVCSNTLRASVEMAKFEASIFHQGDAEERVREAVEAGRKAMEFGERFAQLGSLLANTPYTEEFGELLAGVILATKAEKTWLREQQDADERLGWVPDLRLSLTEQLLAAGPHIPDELIPASAKAERGVMERLIMAGTGVGGTELEGTAWGAFNGVAEYLDHAKTYRDGKRAKAGDRRAEAILWGSAADAKSDALEVILAQTGQRDAASALLAA